MAKFPETRSRLSAAATPFAFAHQPLGSPHTPGVTSPTEFPAGRGSRGTGPPRPGSGTFALRALEPRPRFPCLPTQPFRIPNTESAMLTLPEIRVGDPLRHEALTVFPLFDPSNGKADYLLS